MSRGANLSNAGVTAKQLEEAVYNALILAGVGGGGGGGETFPDALVTGVGSYSIPVGFNAIVRVECANGDAFSINGQNALQSNDYSVVRLFASGSNNFSLTIPALHYGTVFGSRNDSINSSWSANIGGVPAGGLPAGPVGYNSGNYMEERHIGPSGSFGMGRNGNTSNASAQGFATGRQSTRVSQTFKVPEGTMINGGTSRIVELYAI